MDLAPNDRIVSLPTKILVGLGWDERATDGAAFDLDASAFILSAQGRVRSDADFIFYNNLRSGDGSVEHLGDNTTCGVDPCPPTGACCTQFGLCQDTYSSACTGGGTYQGDGTSCSTPGICP